MPARRGFTLIEMLVVLGIVAILATAALPLHELTLRRTQEQALREGLRSIRLALDAHREAVLAKRIAPGPGGSPWPASLQVLVQGVPLIDDQGQAADHGPRLYLLRRLPRDPFADPTLDAADSWGQRASDSPPEAPSAGADVFDVRSRADHTALDGSRYRDW
ncbi:MAG: general secretion pathway protein GspG [Burkholderiales bacterium RIFCSPHIGHO2_12_FULL_69_20]|nr:MAG: general secretion pathway protein GspG [Burkholderiales bacterium RIFCSPHIGHO2_12_FULL_69_20]